MCTESVNKTIGGMHFIPLYITKLAQLKIDCLFVDFFLINPLRWTVALAMKAE